MNKTKVTIIKTQATLNKTYVTIDKMKATTVQRDSTLKKMPDEVASGHGSFMNRRQIVIKLKKFGLKRE